MPLFGLMTNSNKKMMKDAVEIILKETPDWRSNKDLMRL
jgi:hypothetical protein